MERDFTEYVNDWEGLRRGRLAVGGSSLFSSLLLPPMMASFRERYPGITLTLAEETTPRLEEMLRQGTVDLVVDYTIPNMELYDSATVREDALILAVPRAAAVNARLAPYRIAPEQIGAAARNAAPRRADGAFEGRELCAFEVRKRHPRPGGRALPSRRL